MEKIQDRQQVLEAYVRPSSSDGGDSAIYQNNKADLDMAIVYLSHAKAISSNIGDSYRFRKVITLAKTFGTDDFPPNRNMIGGDMLDLNWKSYQIKTTKDLIYRADVFGIVFLGDLTTIKGRPLINTIASSFNVPVAVLGVKDCSKHLVQGGNKDTTFILESFKRYLKQYNDKKSCTDLVFFDGVSNVHKAVQILAPYYPWKTVLHGANQMLYLFSPTFRNYQLSG